MDRSCFRYLPPVAFALLSAATIVVTVAGNEASGQNGVTARESAGTAPGVTKNTSTNDTSARTLRLAVNGQFLIGTAVMSRQLDDPKLAALVAQQFDCLTGENEFKPKASSRSRACSASPRPTGSSPSLSNTA